jgi:type IV pilus assembly protein PilW
MAARRLHRGARGMSLIELLVGIAIGLIGTLIMFRMVSLWDVHTRSTTAGGDAQVSGSLAMFNLERDIRQAGMGFGSADAPLMGCTVSARDGARVFDFRLRPVEIVPGAGAAPDEIRVLYGNSGFFGSQQRLESSAGESSRLVRRGGFNGGDLAVIAGNASALPGSAACALIEVTSASAVADGKTINHASAGGYTNFYTGSASAVPRYNPSGGVGSTFASGGFVFSLGPQPILNVWSVSASGVLTRSEMFRSPTVPFDIAERVVTMKAQYGVDANGNGRIETAEWTAVAPADWTTVLAVRTAILVRSRQFEKVTNPELPTPVAVTASRPTWGDGLQTFTMTNVDGTPDTYGPTDDNPNNWRYYRYRVYERIVPLRNMIWGAVAP